MSQFRNCDRNEHWFRFGLEQVDQSNSSISTAQLAEAFEEAGDDLLLREVAGEAVGGQNRAAVRLMRLAQRRRHARLVAQFCNFALLEIAFDKVNATGYKDKCHEERCFTERFRWVEDISVPLDIAGICDYRNAGHGGLC